MTYLLIWFIGLEWVLFFFPKKHSWMCHQENHRKCSVRISVEGTAQRAPASEEDLTKKNDFCGSDILHTTAFFWVNNHDEPAWDRMWEENNACALDAVRKNARQPVIRVLILHFSSSYGVPWNKNWWMGWKYHKTSKINNVFLFNRHSQTCIYIICE